MDTKRIKHQRYLIMAESVGDKGGFVSLNAAGKIVNAVPKDRAWDLIPPGTDTRGWKIYAVGEPHYVLRNHWLLQGIKEIYFAAEGNSVTEIYDAHIEGINYEDDIFNLTAQIRSSGSADVPSKT